MSKHDQTRIDCYQFFDDLQNMGRTGRDQQSGPDGDRSGAERAGDQQGGPDRDQSSKQASQKPLKDVFTKTLGGAAGTQDRTAPGGLPWDQQGGPDGNRSKNGPKRSIGVERH